MNEPVTDPTVLRRAVTDALTAGRTAAQVLDADGRPVWVSARMLVPTGADGCRRAPTSPPRSATG